MAEGSGSEGMETPGCPDAAGPAVIKLETLESRARAVASRFGGGDGTVGIGPLGKGLINDTFLVTPDGAPRFVLQRLNRGVFPDPPSILHNLRVIEEYLQGSAAPERGGTAPLVLPRLVRTQEGEDFLVDGEGDFWRAMEYLEGSETLEAIDDLDRAEQVGLGLARFHRLLSGIDTDKLRDTLPGFHVTSQYLQEFRDVLQALELRQAREVRIWEEFITERMSRATVLEQAWHLGTTTLRVIHGDPKLNNFLFWRYGKRVTSLIDLDTVRPGLIHHDLGDCLRSCCNLAGELPSVGGSVMFDLDIATAILRGYLSEAWTFLRPGEVALIGSAVWLLPFELGVRFLNDYLSGNRYFKVAEPQQNLQRAVVQFRLAESIERAEPQIEEIVAGLAERNG